MNTSTTAKTTTAAAVTASAAVRQPCASISRASIGRKINCPVAFAADSTPVTRPRRASNQRVATIAASTMDVTPVPVPTQTPQSSISCHWLRIVVVSATEIASKPTAARITRRMPKRSITDAANGPIRPKSAMLMATAPEIAARFHPNSDSSGTIRTPGTARIPAVTRRMKNVTIAMIQA